MKYEVFSRSKYRDGVKPGDDAVLLIPDVLAAVLDGATDPQGGQKNGKSPGQFAAQAVAQACASLFLDPDNLLLSAKDITSNLSQELKTRVHQQNFVGTPSTTLALALFLPGAVRILCIGDSGVRINGNQVSQFNKLIDEVSAASRVAVFKILHARISDLDHLEYTTRKVVFRGLSRAVDEGVLARSEMNSVIEMVGKKFSSLSIGADIAAFLEQGIVSQNQYANMVRHPLGFSALNGALVSQEDVIDITLPASTIQTIELFSDGYQRLPSGQKVADWEQENHVAQAEDFHNIGVLKSVKGATSTEFFDDRSVISIRL